MSRTASLCVAISLLTLGVGGVSAQNVRDPGKDSLDRALSNPDNDPPDRSHSHLGAAFDQGPRRQAHLLTGVGNVHFPITTTSPEAQKFFDQGVNLLYCFSWYEAERSFRQTALLDPDCAMAYWGMAMSDDVRGKEFIKLAQQKQEHGTDREKRYIAALAINFRDGDEKARVADNVHALEDLVQAYPDDGEARAMLAWSLYRQQQSSGVSYKMAIDALLRQVLAKNPMHPGAHHFRIHMWDGPDARYALDSCRALSKAAPNVGHALHMPGHIYSRLGMWDDANYSMDASARAERKYFYADGQLPYESWDYGHDQDFLISNLGYGGRLHEGAALAWELIDIPRDPQYNTGVLWSTAGQGRFGLMRMRVRGERWDEILTGPDPGWTADKEDQAWKAYTFGLAYLGKGDIDNARKQSAELDKLNAVGDTMECARLELRGRIAIVTGDAKVGLEALKKAADIEKAKFKYGDPIGYPRPLYETLAWAQIQTKQWADAEATLKEGLERNPNSGFALCLQIQCLLGEGRREEAVADYQKLRVAWAHADADLPQLKAIQALGLDSEQRGNSAFPTPYKPPSELTKIGPARWQPFPAPDAAITDKDGKTVHISDFRGHNLLLVFTLGGSCPRCNRQLDALGKEQAAFAALDTKIISVSTDSVPTIQAFLAGNPAAPIQLYSDPHAIAARRFKAVDEFENLDLHAIYMIDRKGRVWWYRTGVEPFYDVAFLKSEIARMDAWSNSLTQRNLTASH